MSRYRRLRIDGGTYFFTVALADRSSNLLVREIGRFRRVYRSVQERRPFETVAICILPDHIHAIWAPPDGEMDYSLRWILIESAFTRGLSDEAPRSASKRTKWSAESVQRRCWEHTIRDDSDFERHVHYVHFNPVKYGLVARVGGWPHSSFHRFVREGIVPADWGGDVMDIPGRFGE